MSAATLGPRQKRSQGSRYSDDPSTFTKTGYIEGISEAAHALDVVELHVDNQSSHGRSLETLRYVEEAMEHEVKRRRGDRLNELPKPPGDLGA